MIHVATEAGVTPCSEETHPIEVATQPKDITFFQLVNVGQ